MRRLQLSLTALLFVFGAALWACGGGGGGDGDKPGSGDFEIQDISTTDSRDSAVFSNTVVELGFSATGPRPSADPSWSVSQGSLSATPPGSTTGGSRHFSSAGDRSTSATGEKVYWQTPGQGGTANVTLNIGSEASLSKQFTVDQNPLAYETQTLDNGDVRVDVSVSNVNSFHQAAFRVYYPDDQFGVREVNQGGFVNDPLFFSYDNSPGFVPVAISVKRGNPRPSGSGELASVVLFPTDDDNGSSAVSSIRVSPRAQSSG